MDIFDTDDLDVTIDQDADYLEQLVGDGKKFGDVKALAKGKAESDQYIKVLLSRLDEANKELTTRTNLESFLDQMKAQRQPQEIVQPVVLPDATKELDDSEIEKRLEGLLAKREAQRTQESNAERVKRVLSEKLGDRQGQFISQKSAELQMSREDLSAFAQRSPSAFFRLVGIDEAEGHQPAGIPSAKSSFNITPTSSVKNKAYFDKMKKDNPTQYRSPKTTGEMMKAMAECRQRGIAWE